MNRVEFEQFRDCFDYWIEHLQQLRQLDPELFVFFATLRAKIEAKKHELNVFSFDHLLKTSTIKTSTLVIPTGEA